MKKILLVVFMLSLSLCAVAQKADSSKDYVGRYDLFAGYSYLNSPKIGLVQNGVNVQAGVHLRRWLVFGADYSIQFGQAKLVTSELKPEYATALNNLVAAGKAGALAGYGMPASYFTDYKLYAPFDATTQTFTIGPQVVFPRYKKLVFFAHPAIGAIRENISLSGHDAFTNNIVIPRLVSSGVLHTTKPSDLTYFYGAGGGVDYLLSKHWRARANVEFVHVFLYSGLLADSRNTVRLSFGPAYNFGPALKK